VGGWGSSDEEIYGDVEVAKINDDGSLTEWSLEKHALKAPRYACGLTLIPPTDTLPPVLLASGGLTTNGKYLDEMEYAAIEPQTGSVGPWTVVPEKMSFPTPRAHHAAFYENGIMTIVGGESIGQLSLGDVESSAIRVSRSK